MALEDEIRNLAAAISKLNDTIAGQNRPDLSAAPSVAEAPDNVLRFGSTTTEPAATEADTQSSKKKKESQAVGANATKDVGATTKESEKPEDGKAVDFETLKAVFLDACDKNLDATLAALGKHNAERLSQVPPAKFTELHTTLKEISGD